MAMKSKLIFEIRPDESSRFIYKVGNVTVEDSQWSKSEAIALNRWNRFRASLIDFSYEIKRKQVGH